MRYKKVKEIVECYYSMNDIDVKFGLKFRIYPRLRKQMKQWSKEVIKGNKL